MDVGQELSTVNNNTLQRSVLADSNTHTYRLDKKLSDFKDQSENLNKNFRAIESIDDIINENTNPQHYHGVREENARDAAAPTSFSGLFSNPGLKSQGSKEAQYHASKVKTFADVSQSLVSFSGPTGGLIATDWLPQLQQSTRQDTSGNRIEETGAASVNVDPCPHPIMDWTPCKQVKIVCPPKQVTPSLLKQVRSLPKNQVFYAESNCCSVSQMDFSILSDAQKLIAATVQWRFPQNGLSQDVVKTMPKDVVNQRRHDWCEALCSVYDAYRAGKESCPVFYVKSPEYQQGRSNSFHYTAMFANSNINGRSRAHAVLSRSTQGFRNMLQKLGIGFESPLLKDPLASKDQGSRSVLLFEGAVRVHGLFDVLMNVLHTNDDCDVPLIISPVAFRNGSLERLRIKESNLNDGQTVLEMSELFIPPWVVSRLLVLMGSISTDGLDIRLSPIADAVPMNWAVGSDAVPVTEDEPNQNDYMVWTRQVVLSGVSLEHMKFTHKDGLFHCIKTTPLLAPV
eukprot:jgi/Picsp_1/3479/NSC_06317-R1_protein